MPLQLTDRLGPQVDAATGRWIPNSETYLEAISGAMTQRRLLLAQVSDVYLVRWYMQVTSLATLGAVTPQVNFFTYGTGAGKAVFQRGTAMATTDLDATSSTWMMVRSASSDIFITTTASANGALPAYNLYVSISRPS